MGEYAPEDQRTIHKNAGTQDTMSNWHDIEKTERERQHDKQHDQQSDDVKGAQPGDQQQALDAQIGGPRPEYDQYEVNQAGNINAQAQAQDSPGDGDQNLEGLRSADPVPPAQQEQEDEQSRAQPGEVSGRPDIRAAADANRPLGES